MRGGSEVPGFLSSWGSGSVLLLSSDERFLWFYRFDSILHFATLQSEGKCSTIEPRQSPRPHEDENLITGTLGNCRLAEPSGTIRSLRRRREARVRCIRWDHRQAQTASRATLADPRQQCRHGHLSSGDQSRLCDGDTLVGTPLDFPSQQHAKLPNWSHLNCLIQP
jgi:hypothetical protein